ncbi:uncharacterized protein LOC144152733 isoform X2 [Haemaphysalis longicornis]
MWSGPAGPWNQWPIHASMYQNVPHEQVDWAQLAKQWIQMQQAPSGSEPPMPAQNAAPHMAPRAPAPSLPPPQQAPVTTLPTTVAHKPMQPTIVDDAVERPSLAHRDHQRQQRRRGFLLPEATQRHPEPAGSQGGMPPAALHHPPGGGYWGQPPPAGGWMVGDTKSWHSTMAPPPQGMAGANMAGPPPPMGVSERETFDYGHVSSSQPLASQSYDYNHGGPEQYAQYAPPPPVMDGYANALDPYHQQYWNVGPNTCPPPFLRKGRVEEREEVQVPFLEEEGPQIDAAKRKTLPGWIREGLEKMEREKMRKLEREKEESERRARLSKQARGDGHLGDPTKSKFDSDSEDEKEEAVDMFSEGPRARASPPKSNGDPQPAEPASPEAKPVTTKEEAFRFQTPEERHQEMMLKVRRLLTELLLEVTNEEIASVAQEVYQRAVLKAPARQLRSSSALAHITGGLGGLSGYGSDSESSSGGEESGKDSDEELKRSIRSKRAAFAAWEHQVTEELDEEDRRQDRRLRQQQQQQQQQLAAEKVTEDVGVRSTNRPAEKSPPARLDHEPPGEAGHEEEPGQTAVAEEKKVDGTSASQDSSPATTTQPSDEKLNDQSSSSTSSSSSSEDDSSELDTRHQEKKKPAPRREKSSRQESSKSSSDKTSSSKKRRERRSRSSSRRRKSRSRSRERKDKRRSRRHRSTSSSSGSRRHAKRRSRSKDRKERRKRRRSSSSSYSKSRSRSRSHTRHRSRSRSSKHSNRKKDRSRRSHSRSRRRRHSSESQGSGKRSSRKNRDR